jgi:hypothetical protein
MNSCNNIRSSRMHTHTVKQCLRPAPYAIPVPAFWISYAQIAAIAYTAFASTSDHIIARLVVRRVAE